MGFAVSRLFSLQGSVRPGCSEETLSECLVRTRCLCWVCSFTVVFRYILLRRVWCHFIVFFVTWTAQQAACSQLTQALQV